MTTAPQKTRGGITYIARRGPGPTVVFLHGIGSNAASFLPVLDLLPDYLNIVMWNAPGYLGSDPVDDPWPLPGTYAVALLGLLDDLALRSVHLVGHSLGTLHAASFARLFPDRVDSLILASAACGHGIAKNGDLPEKVRVRIDDLNRLGPAGFAKARAANLIHEPASNAGLVAQVERAMSHVSPVGYTQAAHLLASGDLPAELASVRIRPGFIIGSEDKVTPIAQTKIAASAWKASHGSQPTVRSIEGAGHAVYLQKPSEFCANLLAFLPAESALPAGAALHHKEI